MGKTEMQECSVCLLPQTHETITFNEKGICSVCGNLEKKLKVSWESRREDLDTLIAEKRSLDKDYDCVIPFSGGKDSTFSLYFVVNELKLKPLVTSFDHGFYRPKILENRNKVLKKLGVDFVSFTPNWKLVKKLMLISLRDKGDFCWHCHTGISSYPFQVAIEKNIPLIIWGESSTEYTNYYKTEEFHNIGEDSYNKIANLGISAEDMQFRLNGEFSLRDLKPFSFPSKQDVLSKGISSFPLGNYIKWDTKKQVEIIKNSLGWEGDQVEGVPPGYDYEKIECMMQGMRDYLKYRKRGYSRTTHLVAMDLRNGKLSKDEGTRLILDYEGQKPYSINMFLEMLDLKEDELEEIIKAQIIAPWDGKIPVKIGPKPKDYEVWKNKLLVD
jgi:N-acetyl sugar amidotransferase